MNSPKTKLTRWKPTIFSLATDNIMSEIPRKILTVAYIRFPEKFAKPIVRPILELQYNELRRKVSKKFKFVDDEHSVIIFVNGKYMLMSQLMELLKKEKCGVTILTKPEVEPCWTRNLFNHSVISPKRDYIYFNIHIEGNHVGYLIIEVFTDINPKISNSFVQLFTMDGVCLGHYHIFREGWLEFGVDPPNMPGRGNNHNSLMSHNMRGILSFCQDFDLGCDAFFLHFVPCTFFDEFRTVLGRVVHGDRVLYAIEELESEFGRLSKDFSIYGCGIIPIGRNQPEEIDADWEEAMFRLFEAPGPKYQSNKLVEQKDEFESTEIVCPMFNSDIEQHDVSGSESMSVKSSDKSIMTNEPWDGPLDIGTITFDYNIDDPTPLQPLDESCKEFMDTENAVDPCATTSIVDISLNTQMLPIDVKELSESEDQENPAQEIHAISMAALGRTISSQADYALSFDEEDIYDQGLLTPLSSVFQIFPPVPRVLQKSPTRVSHKSWRSESGHIETPSDATQSISRYTDKSKQS